MRIKRLTAILLCLCMALTLLPATAWAADAGVSYIDKDGQTRTSPSAEVITKTLTFWGENDSADHWYVAQGDITIGRRITVTGDVHLILADGSALTASLGIGVSSGSSLTV